jgi:hypothetical protein
MSWRADEAMCGRTARIGEALLDGVELAASDRIHLAGCAACAREADRAASFVGRLALAAEWAMDEVPDATTSAGARPLRSLRRILASGAVLAGAVAAGLLLAAVIGLRLSAPVGSLTSLGSAHTAAARLAALDLVCIPTNAGATCESVAPDHVHRVQLSVTDDAIRGVEAGIIGTTGRPIDLRGADDLLRRMTIAALSGPQEAAATAWLAETYAGCEGTCSADVDGMHMELERRDDAAILTIEAR